MVEAPELSYLFDFIDIDESGQVNLEELHLQMMMGNVLICFNPHFCYLEFFSCKEILFLETDSEARVLMYFDNL